MKNPVQIPSANDEAIPAVIPAKAGIQMGSAGLNWQVNLVSGAESLRDDFIYVISTEPGHQKSHSNI